MPHEPTWYEVLIGVVREERSGVCVRVLAYTPQQANQLAREALRASLDDGNDDTLAWNEEWEPEGPETVDLEDSEIVESGIYEVTLTVNETPADPTAGLELPGLKEG